MLSAHELIGDALYLNGDYKAALAEFENEPSEVGRLSGMAGAHYGLGNKSESDVALHELIEKYADQPASIAFVFSERGEIDRAFEWLQKAVALRDPSIANAANVTWLRNLHDDRRWLPFLRKIGKAPEQLAAIKFELTVPHH
jgi:tetratricopeptide (TPR) repeat protein